MMFPGDKPGLGVDIDEALAAQFPYRRAYLPIANSTAPCIAGDKKRQAAGSRGGFYAGFWRERWLPEPFEWFELPTSARMASNNDLDAAILVM
jgi:hypothetical protein